MCMQDLAGYAGGKKKIKAIAAPCVGKYHEHSGLQFVLAAVTVFSILFLS